MSKARLGRRISMFPDCDMTLHSFFLTGGPGFALSTSMKVGFSSHIYRMIRNKGKLLGDFVCETVTGLFRGGGRVPKD